MHIYITYIYNWASLVAQMIKICPQCKSPGFDPWSGRSPGEGNGYPLQYPCLENSTDRGAWQATVYRVSKSQTQLSNFHFHGIKMLSTLSNFLFILPIKLHVTFTSFEERPNTVFHVEKNIYIKVYSDFIDIPANQLFWDYWLIFRRVWNKTEKS